VTPVVVEVPLRETLCVLQVSKEGAEAVTPVGVALFCVTVTIEIDLQPFVGFVTVNVSIPGKLTLGFCNVDLRPFVPDQL
jgi:hypothetical protein